MTRAKRRVTSAVVILVLLTVTACGSLGGGEPPEAAEAVTSAETPAGPGASEGRCGDGVCDGPENDETCPQDCAEATAPPTETFAIEGRCGDGVCDGPENEQNCPDDCGSAPGPSAGVSDACLNPNPRHAIVSEELTDWYNWLEDGGFEEGVAEVVISDHSVGGLDRAKAERTQEAARTGSYGYAIVAGPSEGVIFSIEAYVDKGEDARFSFWARSLGSRVHDSGLTRRTGRTTKAGRRDIRAVIIETAHVASNTHLHWQAELARLEPRLGHNKAIVAIARKILVAVWHVLTEGCPDRFAEPEQVARKLLKHAERLGKANRPTGQTAAQYVRQQLDRLGLGADLTAIQRDKRTISLPPSRLTHEA